MMVRLSAAVCGAAFMLVYPAKMITTATGYSFNFFSKTQISIAHARP